MLKAIKYPVICLLMALASQGLFAQVIETEGSFLTQLQERDSVLVADQLLYGFELKGVEDSTALALPDWTEGFCEGVEVLRQWQFDTLQVNKPRKGQRASMDVKASIVITSFDEGEYLLPRIAVQRMSPRGEVDTLVFDSQTLQVKTMPVDTATFVPHDIKAQVRYPVTFKELLPYFGGLLALAGLVVLLVWLIRKYRRQHDPAYIKKDPAHIVALRKLDQYRGNKMWAADKQKAFYSGVTDTLREYMSSRYEFSAMEMTTKEIFDIMKKTDAPSDLQSDLKELFERADFVKFAKYVASDEDNASVLPLAVRFVTTTYQEEITEEIKEEVKEE